MAADLRSIARKAWRRIASIETGVVLLMLVVILAAVGTLILQRPMTRPEEMQSAYSPFVLQILDAAGLTDVYHSWWFLGLLLLVNVSILASSIDRFPGRWRYFSAPNLYPDESFRRAVHPQASLAVCGGEAGERTALAAAERALQSRGYNPVRTAHQGHFGIFAERHRISELAVFIVHLSLLLIFLGNLVDSLWGWRGTLQLNEGQSSSRVEMPNGTSRALPFYLRCEAAGRENYADGTPKKLWTKLAVVEDGQDAQKKEIAVNDPLLYKGIRFFQSSDVANGRSARLNVSHEPGQWEVWSGIVLLGIGLVFVFYVAHLRFWVIPVREQRSGRRSLWIGARTNRNRESLEKRFNDLVASIDQELKAAPNASREQPAQFVEACSRQ
jgi:cytochrome c biogenesis protein